MLKEVRIDRWESQIEIQVPKFATVVESEARGGQSSDPIEKIRNALRSPLGMERIKTIVKIIISN